MLPMLPSASMCIIHSSGYTWPHLIQISWNYTRWWTLPVSIVETTTERAGPCHDSDVSTRPTCTYHQRNEANLGQGKQKQITHDAEWTDVKRTHRRDIMMGSTCQVAHLLFHNRIYKMSAVTIGLAVTWQILLNADICHTYVTNPWRQCRFLNCASSGEGQETAKLIFRTLSICQLVGDPIQGRAESLQHLKMPLSTNKHRNM